VQALNEARGAAPSQAGLDLFICAVCKSVLTGSAAALQCTRCHASFPIVQGVPLFSPADAGQWSRSAALAEATFKSPLGYAFVVKAKRAVFKDAMLGTEDAIRGQVVLDVGCGPNLDFEHLENHHASAKRYIGIDLSAEFVLSARRRHADPRYVFAQASACSLPLASKSVDTTILSFTLHHVSGDPRVLIDEMLRVTRSRLIILDHVRSERTLTGAIQSAYWRIFDGGCNYLTNTQWRHLLDDLSIERRVDTGAVFGHVVKFRCALTSLAAR